MAGHKNHESDAKKSKTPNPEQTTQNFNKSFENTTSDKKFREKIKIWTSYYRQFPYKFVEDYLGIHLKLFQKILLYCMMHFYFFMFIASRGLGKTWLTAIFCVCRAVLYPESKIILTSGNKSQAVEIITYIQSFKNASECLNREICYLSDNINNAKVEFFNGSWIRVVASNEGARSKRANLIIVDEFRMVDKEIIDTVIRKFKANPRQPAYLNKPQYKHLAERNIEIYMSSAWYKSHWSWTKLKAYFNAMMKGKKYFLCDLPYQLTILEGLRLREEVLDEMQEDDFDAIKWQMEMEGVFLGETENAFYKFEELSNSRTINKVLYPKKIYENIKDNSFKYEKKKDGEIRIVFADIAMMKGIENDASSYGIMRLIPRGSNFIRYVPYMENMVGGHTQTQATRIRQLYEDFEADYIVLDTQNAGISIFDLLCQPLFDKERNIEYEPLNCINDERLQERCVYSYAPKKIYSVRANPQFNSDIAYALKDTIRREKLKLLIHENESSEILSKMKGYGEMDTDLKAKLLSPYLQITALINEMINLEAEINSQTNIVKLKEPRSGRKDRYTALAYSNFYANVLEKTLLYEETYDDDDELVYY